VPVLFIFEGPDDIPDERLLVREEGADVHVLYAEVFYGEQGRQVVLGEIRYAMRTALVGEDKRKKGEQEILHAS